MELAGQRVLLGVSGGVAAYKAILVARELMRRGANVDVVLTKGATRFVTPLSFSALTGRPPIVDLWDPSYPGEVHVELAARADLVLVAPATANLMARIAHGMADDALTATLLCFDGPVLVAPAMHPRMWERLATRRNVAQLEGDGVEIVGPIEGPLASGEVGMGRMVEPEALVSAVIARLARRDLAGRKILVTAGGTQEDLDPVRFLGNRSTGKMGYALAERAASRGASVTLVSGPTRIAPPAGVDLVAVRSAREMETAVTSLREGSDVIIMAAAVADYRPAEVAPGKIKKGGGGMQLELVRNPDILAGLGAWREGARPMLVGFAVETESLVERARGKLEKKKVDLIVANEARHGFGRDENRVVLVDAEGEEALPDLPKREVAERILDRIARTL